MRATIAFFALLLPGLLTGCRTGETYWPDAETLKRFEAAGPVQPELDVQGLIAAAPKQGPYRVVAGDILEFRGLEAVVAPSSSGPNAVGAIQARVFSDGTVRLPVLGTLTVVPEPHQGLTLEAIDTALGDLACPKFVARRPLVITRVIEPGKVKVAVMGAVERPGIVELTSDMRTLFGALTLAGGIGKANATARTGARVIRVHTPGVTEIKPVLLPLKGLDIPFADIALQGGETIEVERWEPTLFTVLGLVRNPGAFEYPWDSKYTLLQALAKAGGTDLIADPPYATVIRSDERGNLIPVTFPINAEGLLEAAKVQIRPGDVIAVEHTVGTWTRTFLKEVFQVQLGVFFTPTLSNLGK